MKASESDSTLSNVRTNRIVTVTLNRPDKLNAFIVRMRRNIAEAFRRADEDAAVQVLPDDRWLSHARKIVREIIDNTVPVAFALTCQMLWRLSAEPSPFPVLKVDGPLALRLGSGPDVREGVAAFLEKRPPVFPGRVSSDMPTSYPWWEA